jgi:hypothetical protein
MPAPNRQPNLENDPMGGSPEEYTRAMPLRIAHAGSFSLHGQRVVHHVTRASCPDCVGSDQPRQGGRDGDRLTLGVDRIVVSGQPDKAAVAWKKAPSGV